MPDITRRSFRFVKRPEEEQLDVFAHLDRFSLLSQADFDKKKLSYGPQRLHENAHVS
ncbi:hypothetical protein AAVH_26615 [Aphelenchoides avenae]|nr:hypothetical protein AAVH_26615 [Aphelenchus avenae]